MWTVEELHAADVKLDLLAQQILTVLAIIAITLSVVRKKI